MKVCLLPLSFKTKLDCQSVLFGPKSSDLEPFKFPCFGGMEGAVKLKWRRINASGVG